MRWIILMSLALGISFNICVLVLWWYAMSHGWAATARFNDINEGVIEGVMLHLVGILQVIGISGFLVRFSKS